MRDHRRRRGVSGTGFSTPMNRRSLVRAGAGGLAAGALVGSPALARRAAQEATPYNGEEVTITYGFWDAVQQPGVEAQIEAFNAQFPNITVDPQLTPYTDYWTRIQTGIAGGETYDVFWLETTEFPAYAAAGALMPIEPILGSDGIDPAMYPQNLVESYTYDGQIYAVPRDFDTIGLFYNTDLFDEAGVEYPTGDWTWDDLRSAAEELTIGEGDSVSQWGFAVVVTVYQGLFNFVLQNGGPILSEDLATCLLDDPASCEAIDFMTSFHTDGLSPSVAIQQATYPAQGVFPAGQLAMMPGGSWYVGPFAEANPAIQVAPLPRGTQQAAMIHGIGNGIWVDTPNAGAAMEFVRFLGSEEAEVILGESTTVTPAMEGTQQVWLDSVPDMDLQVFLDAVEYAQVMPAPESGTEWQANVEDVLVGVWSGEIPVEEACARAAEEANAAL